MRERCAAERVERDRGGVDRGLDRERDLRAGDWEAGGKGWGGGEARRE